MTLRIATIVLVGLLAISAEAADWNGIVASWAMDNSTHFYKLPITLEAAQEEGWTKISGVHPPRGSVALGYQDDPTVVLIYNVKNGEVFGIQIGFPKADVENSGQPMDYDNIPEIREKTLNGVAYYTATAYFHSDDGGKYNRQLFFQNGDDLLEIPTNASLITTETEFVRKNCVPAMGYHYYTLRTEDDCPEYDTLFLLTTIDEVVGFGFQGFGTSPPVSNRTWFEDITIAGIVYTIPDIATCALDAFEQFGVINLHVWLVDDVNTIFCD